MIRDTAQLFSWLSDRDTWSFPATQFRAPSSSENFFAVEYVPFAVRRDVQADPTLSFA